MPKGNGIANSDHGMGQKNFKEQCSLDSCNQRGTSWDSKYLVRGCEESVVAHCGFMVSLESRVVLGTL